MMEFKHYLESLGFTASTVKESLNCVKRFDGWWQLEQYTDADRLTYRELLGFVEHMQQKQVSRATINLHLSAVTKYYEFLMSDGVRTDNPARRLRVKKDGPKVHADLFKPGELDELYIAFKNRDTFREESHRLRHHRNSLLLSMIIYQGLSATDLKVLETHHIDFDAGTLDVPETTKAAGRLLKLHPSQILSLFQYTSLTRTKLPHAEHVLFGGDINNILWLIIQELRRVRPDVRNVNQLRTSVIVNWVRQHGIRQAQYMAGHRDIGSTERFRVQDIESLKEAVFKYHPLG